MYKYPGICTYSFHEVCPTLAVSYLRPYAYIDTIQTRAFVSLLILQESLTINIAHHTNNVSIYENIFTKEKIFIMENIYIYI